MTLHITLQPRQTTLSRSALERAIADQLEVSPAAQAAYADVPGHTNSSQPAISVVVCTRDRAQSLGRCLKALERLDYETYEVIVVDSASVDAATAQAVATTPFRCVREDRPGLNWARNRGTAEARYEIIAFVDDDVQVDSGWLRGVARTFADSRVAAMTGLVLPAELETRAQKLFEQYGGMSKGLQARQFQRRAMQPRDMIAVQTLGVGANMAFRRSMLEALGGFDAALDVGTPAAGGGDLDMFHRTLVAGFTWRYEPTALVWHQHRRDMAGLRRQLHNNGRSFGVYLLKVWRRRSVERFQVVDFTLRWVGGWLLARLCRRLLGRLDFPLALVWAELWGALHSPWAYFATYRHDHRLRGSDPIGQGITR